ncbi:hypothetical protein VPNG_08100 [Cytospora leucostoma]|uniref:Uncharacterized protein n=1 Tax=Cytospora leucostoma TaxID=1230097 RepID=A0A423WSI1_9PEZI|nr:hypothetical protein VPNG_08100 [Cytospora leucostoma]
MVGRKKLLEYFIDDIPDEKITPPPDHGTVFTDGNFRLDVQGITSNNQWNLQVQVNYRPKKSSLTAYAPDTVAGPALVPKDDPWTAAQIKQKLKETSTL